MAAKDEPIICELCEKGCVIRRAEDMAFWQWSDKGYVHCRVTVLTGTCDYCHAKSFDPGLDRIFDEAFQREYDKLP